MFLILQQLENNLIYPRVVGTSIGLPGMWVLMAVTVGGELMGVAGMLLYQTIENIGMCLAMQVIGEGTAMFVLGIIIGVIGFSACGINYPVYKKLLKKGKEKYAFEIVELAKEISGE